MFCTNCGKEIDNDAEFCIQCGARIESVTTNVYDYQSEITPWQHDFDSNLDMGVAGLVLNKMQTSYALFIAIGISQILIGFGTMCYGYGIFVLGIGICNIVLASKEKKKITYFNDNPKEIYPYFERKKVELIIFLVLNMFLGAVVGSVCIVYELSVRSYVMKHKAELTQ